MSKKPATEAIHAQDGNDHVVAVSQLRVLLLKEDAGWFAQGLEIDYAATGCTMEETKDNFESGFYKTVHEYIVLHGSIDKLLVLAPKEAWAEFYKMSKDSIAQRFSCVQLHSTKENNSLPDDFPYNEITFISQPEEALTA